MRSDPPPGGRATGPTRRRRSRCAPRSLDSHCHLDIRDGDAWMAVDDALAAPRRSASRGIVQIGCDLPGARWAVDVAATHERHRRRRRAAPERGAAHRRERGRRALDDACAEIDALAAHERVRAVGETGLDFFRTGRGRARRAGGVVPPAHRDGASEHGKALVIHDRDAHDDVLRILDDEGAPDTRGLPLLQRRRRDGAHVRRARLGPVVRRHRDVQERRSRCATRSP